MINNNENEAENEKSLSNIFVYQFLFYICFHVFFYKQHVCKQHQAEIGEKLSKS